MAIPYKRWLSQPGWSVEIRKLPTLNRFIEPQPKLLKNKLKVDLNLKMSNTWSIFADEGAIGNAVSFDPTKPVLSGNNRYGGYWEWLENSGLPMQLSNRNPAALLDRNLRMNDGQSYRSLGNIQFDYQLPFIKGLRANLNLGYDFSRGSGVNKLSDSAASDYRNKVLILPITANVKVFCMMFI